MKVNQAYIDSLEISVDIASRIYGPDWEAVQNLERTAYTNALASGSEQRSQTEVDYLVRWDRPDEYISVRRDPNRAVADGRLRPNQQFAKPVAVRAFNGDNVVGFLYIADNVSGRNMLDRQIKMSTPQKRYAWVGSVAIHPDAAGKGLASELLLRGLETRSQWQPVSAYIWQELDEHQRVLERRGFRPTDREQPTRIFGPGSKEAMQLRMQAKSVKVLTERVKAIMDDARRFAEQTKDMGLDKEKP